MDTVACDDNPLASLPESNGVEVDGERSGDDVGECAGRGGDVLTAHHDHHLTDSAQQGANKAQYGGLTYGTYLQLDKLLSCQHLASEEFGVKCHDEYLFIITHQTYELWFKQILIEIDSIREMFLGPLVDEAKMLQILSRLNRIVAIEKLLVDQMMILETMSPLDFNEFRVFLAPASGFQSLQFRLLENKLGLKQSDRVKYNRQHYLSVFTDEKYMKQLVESEEQQSLLEVVERWLERTPGLKEGEFNFWPKYHVACDQWLTSLAQAVDDMEEGRERDTQMEELRIQQDTFRSLFHADMHESLKSRGERRLSHKAFQGALMIYMYRDAPRFHQPYNILRALKDIDSLMTKWRYNHVMLVQRMLGSKTGTGGSSGYLYLRSTVSDRYKVFLDLFNLSTFAIPKKYIPPLSADMKRRLSIVHQSADM